MTKNIWVISEDNYGTIGAATSVPAGKQWLIDSKWVTMEKEVRNPQTREFVTLGELYGNDWEEHFLSYDEEELEDMGFFFEAIELHTERQMGVWRLPFHLSKNARITNFTLL